MRSSLASSRRNSLRVTSSGNNRRHRRLFFEHFEPRRLLATAYDSFHQVNIWETVSGTVSATYQSPADWSGPSEINLSEGSFSFTAQGETGTQSFGYSVCDADSCAGATIYITVIDPNANTNYPPTVEILSRTINEDATLIVSSAEILGVASDPESDVLTIDAGFAQHGTVIKDANGDLVYTPTSNYHGSDTVVYSLSDGYNSIWGEINVTIVSINDGLPTAAGDGPYSYDASLAQTYVVSAPGVLQNDQDIDGDLTAHIVTQPAHGSVTLAANGGFVYSPDAAFVGTVTFTYVANDGFVDSPPATVSINVSKTRDVGIVSFTTVEPNLGNEPNLKVQYTVTGGNVPPYFISLYASTASQSIRLESVPGNTSVGTHDAILGRFDDPYEDYYQLSVVVDGESDIHETNESNNEALFSGTSFVFYEPASGQTCGTLPPAIPSIC